MHFPNILEIATKNVTQIDESASLNKAIEKMVLSGHRNIVVTGGHYPHILLAKDMIKFNLQKVDLDTPLNELSLNRLPTARASDNILDATIFLKESIEYIGIEDEEKNLVGLMTHTDIINSIDPEILMENFSIEDVINKHRHDLWVNESDNCQQIMEKMAIHNTDCVLALNDQGKLTGIFTTKDTLRYYEIKQDMNGPLKNYMTSPVITVPPDTSVKEALAFIKQKSFKRVVVKDDNDCLVGMILQRDLISITYNKWATLMRQFQDELQELNQVLAAKTQLYKQMASQDPLTKLYNRHKFAEIFASEFLTMKSRENDMSLLMLDIDHFKEINDNYGHNIGDEVLVEVSELILQQQRQTDVVCRWGGEEFLILLPSANVDQALIIAENLRKKIAEVTFDEPELKITASLGVTQARTDEGLENLVARADDALYQAKREGRNRSIQA